jgi:methionyl aminopeptidase
LIATKTPADIQRMRAAGLIAAEVRQELASAAIAGVTTAELDRLAERKIRRLGGRPGFKGLYGFPASLCVSVNNEIVHGVPGERVLVPGDIVSMDVGVVYRGFCADTALTVPVGEVTREAARLIEATEGALADAIEACRPGNRLGDIGAAVQRRAEGAGFSVVRDFGGHGIGRKMHEEPWVANFGVAGTGPELLPGMALALEPMLNVGGSGVRSVDNAGWAVIVTADSSLSAHFEHTVAVTDGPALVLTAGTRA